MGRILAIDYGEKRIGLAHTDEAQIIASPLETIPGKEIFNYLAFIETISQFFLVLHLDNNDSIFVHKKILI